MSINETYSVEKVFKYAQVISVKDIYRRDLKDIVLPKDYEFVDFRPADKSSSTEMYLDSFRDFAQINYSSNIWESFLQEPRLIVQKIVKNEALIGASAWAKIPQEFKDVFDFVTKVVLNHFNVYSPEITKLYYIDSTYGPYVRKFNQYVDMYGVAYEVVPKSLYQTK